MRALLHASFSLRSSFSSHLIYIHFPSLLFHHFHSAFKLLYFSFLLYLFSHPLLLLSLNKSSLTLSTSCSPSPPSPPTPSLCSFPPLHNQHTHTHTHSVLELWKTDLKQINEKAAEALADPKKYPNLFPDLDWALQVRTLDRAF